MASETIIAPAGAEALEQARQTAARQLLLDGYEAFRSIKDAYEEAPRPSADDVLSVLSVVSAALAVPGDQRTYEPASRDGFGQAVAFTSAGSETEKDAAAVSPGYGAAWSEGRTWYLRLSPGVMGLRCADENKKEQADERRRDRERRAADGAWRGIPFVLPDEPGPAAGEIREWSRRSRSRMSELVGSLDYSEWTQDQGALAMVTLTLPGEWLIVAPDGKTFKRLLKAFEMRWRRAVGVWRCLWKLEFQRRGAPHWHALMRVPALVGRLTFEEWLSATWADVVDHPDPEERRKHELAGTGVDFSGKDFSDPRRISLYFLGHSAKTTDGKEYQHTVPAQWQEPGKGPGRFWGNPGLSSATREIEITERDAVQAARILRKVRRGRAWETAVLRERGKLPLGQREKHRTFSVELRRNADRVGGGRAARRTAQRKAWFATQETGRDFVWKPRFAPSSLGAGGYAVGGWVLVNDALALGLDVARLFTSYGAAPATPAYCFNDEKRSLEIQRRTAPALPGGVLYPIKKGWCVHV